MKPSLKVSASLGILALATAACGITTPRILTEGKTWSVGYKCVGPDLAVTTASTTYGEDSATRVQTTRIEEDYLTCVVRERLGW